MAAIQKIPRGVQCNIISNRYGGDTVDKAINNINKKTGLTITDMVKRSLVLYSDIVNNDHINNDKVKKGIKILKNQKRIDV